MSRKLLHIGTLKSPNLAAVSMQGREVGVLAHTAFPGGAALAARLAGKTAVDDQDRQG
jgi:hypothetical protein